MYQIIYFYRVIFLNKTKQGEFHTYLKTTIINSSPSSSSMNINIIIVHINKQPSSLLLWSFFLSFFLHLWIHSSYHNATRQPEGGRNCSIVRLLLFRETWRDYLLLSPFHTGWGFGSIMYHFNTAAKPVFCRPNTRDKRKQHISCVGEEPFTCV